MNIEAISGAATVAVASTVLFLVIAKSWNALSRTVGSTPSFADSIMHEAAQRFRDELERLSRSQAIYLSSALVFIVLFLAAYALRAQELFAGYPAWQLWLQVAFLALAAIFAGWRLGRTILARHEVKFMRDANIAIGHQLQQIAAGSSRVFHDVATSAGVVDHVVVGPRGIYGINVVARRARKRGSAFLQGNELTFSQRYGVVPLANIAASTARLEKEISRLLGCKVRVRSVIAAPGWDIGEQASENHLLVNERTISMMRGWRDSSDHLMNEDVQSLCDELTARCRRQS
ncbi:MAG: NERD domain-containing protein [Gammaproteobacteria bacterium]|nr:NERD domain-containing protein [Gammaproteobacteria bacterium]MBT8095216.1 NERD domain-containing protein [Gammaproteobacteria bacterium]